MGALEHEQHAGHEHLPERDPSELRGILRFVNSLLHVVVAIAEGGTKKSCFPKISTFAFSHS